MGEREDPCTQYIAGNIEVFYMAIGVQGVRQGRRSRGAGGTEPNLFQKVACFTTRFLQGNHYFA